MTHEEILNKPAGFEIDSLVQSFVMGGLPPVSREILPEFIKPFSGDIKATWEVIKEMSAKNYWFGCQVLSSHCEAWFYTSETSYRALASTYDLPLAICRAALLAVMDKE